MCSTKYPTAYIPIVLRLPDSICGIVPGDSRSLLAPEETGKFDRLTHKRPDEIGC